MSADHGGDAAKAAAEPGARGAGGGLYFHAAFSSVNAQCRKSHIFHGVKSLSVLGLGGAEEVLASLLHAKKGVGEALAPVVLPASLAGTRAQWTASDQARGRHAPRG